MIMVFISLGTPGDEVILHMKMLNKHLIVASAIKGANRNIIDKTCTGSWEED